MGLWVSVTCSGFSIFFKFKGALQHRGKPCKDGFRAGSATATSSVAGVVDA